MISVITPFKDAELWIGRCLESMAKQRGDFQFIIVNDHSEDIGRTIAEDFAKADPRFLVLDNEHTAGVSGARNTGLDHADGEFFTFIDADDEMNDDAWKFFISGTGIDADMYQFDHMRYYPKRDVYKMAHTSCEGWYDAKHLPAWWCMVWNKLYRKSVYGGVRFVEGLQYGEDEVFNFDCADISDKIYASRYATTIHRFDNSASLSKTKDAKGLVEQSHALEDLLFRCKSAKVRNAVLETQSEHWTSATYQKLFVEEKPTI